MQQLKHTVDQECLIVRKGRYQVIVLRSKLVYMVYAIFTVSTTCVYCCFTDIHVHSLCCNATRCATACVGAVCFSSFVSLDQRGYCRSDCFAATSAAKRMPHCTGDCVAGPRDILAGHMFRGYRRLGPDGLC